MKKWITGLLVFVVMFLVVPATDTQAANSSKKAYKAYRTWLTKKAPSKYKKFALTDLDGDGTSELVGHYKKGETDFIIICSYNGKKVATKQFQDVVTTSGGYRASLQYIPKTGKILYSTMDVSSGKEENVIYQMKKGKLKRIASGTAKYSMRGVSCRWRNKKVSESTYNNKLGKAFDYSSSKQFTGLKYIFREKIKKKLK